MAFKCEELKVWQRTWELTLSFPNEEIYVLTTQIKRAADSVALNIAEGSTGQSNAEFKKFLGYALRSCIEVVACLHVGRKRELIKQKKFKTLYDEAEEIIKMIQALRNSLK